MKGFRYIKATLLTILILVTLCPVAAIGANPVASWRMDDGSGNQVMDQIGGYSGTLHGGSWSPAAVVFNSSGYTWDLGLGGSSTPWALDFNGKDNYIEIPDAPILRSQNFSIAFWIAPDTSSDWTPIMGKQYYVAGQLSGWTVSWDNEVPRKICFVTYSPPDKESSISVAITLGQWTHITFTYSISAIAAYKNGELVARSTSGSFQPSTEPFRIGRAYGEYHYFDGLMDNVMFYNSYLSQNDIRSLYDSYVSTVQRSTIVELSPTTINPGQDTAIIVRLKDQLGRVLTGANVSFRINNNMLGTVKTDSRGFAQISYRPQDSGTYSLTASFDGVGTYLGCAQTVQLTVANSFPQQTLLIGAVGAVIILGVVIVARKKGGSNNIEWGSDIKDLIK